MRAKLAAAILDASPDWSAFAATRAMGAAAKATLPRGVTRTAIAAYQRYFDVDLSDVDPALMEAGFDSFDEFFTRPLRPGARPVDPDARVWVSPCDGALRDSRRIEPETPIRAKGHDFTLEQLLGDGDIVEAFVGGLATTIYLHPRDYHRVHSPCAGVPSYVRAIPGRLLPVTDAAVERDASLFAKNERNVHLLDTEHGRVAVVMVAAFGVGHMSCSYGDIPAHPTQVETRHFDGEVELEKGGELGMFHLGSTVILVTPKGWALDTVWRIALDAGEMPTLRMGEKLLVRRRDG